MKKSLIALAALAATASFAQSSVTLSGLVDAGYQAIDYKGAKVNGVANNGSATSTIQISGSEDLGGGLKANFKLNSDFDVTRNTVNQGIVSTTNGGTTNSTWLNSEKKVGVSGGFGNVEFGVINNYSLSAFGVGNNFGTAVGGGWRAVTMTDSFGGAASAPRFENTVAYSTPTFSGFTATVRTGKKQTKAADAGVYNTTQFNYDAVGFTEYGVAYNNGPLNVALAVQEQDGVNVAGAAANTKGKLTTLGANYAIGAAKVFALYQTNKYDNNGKDTNFMSGGVDYAMGAITLKALYGVHKNDLATGDKKSNILGLGADYALSKRTALYARYENINDKAGFVANPSNLAAVAGETTRTRTALGVRHSF